MKNESSFVAVSDKVNWKSNPVFELTTIDDEVGEIVRSRDLGYKDDIGAVYVWSIILPPVYVLIFI